MEILDIDKLVSTLQHGFRKAHGTETVVASIVGVVSELLDKKKCVALYSADLTAIFDVLRKEVLVEILLARGVPFYLIKIIHEYLSARMGYVLLGDKVSYVKDIGAGCIQGSTIAPFLLSIYLSDLKQVVSPSNLIAYADDSYVIIEGESVDELKNKNESYCAYFSPLSYRDSHNSSSLSDV